MMPRVRLTRSTLLLSTLAVTAFLFFTFSDSDARSALHVDRLRAPGHVTTARSDEQHRQRDPQPNPNAAPNAAPAADRWHKPQVPIISESLTYAADGLVHGMHKIHRALVKSGHSIQDEQHPITELMERGRRRWEGLLKRQSKTLEHAVIEYEKRYSRKPPLGFDKWFQFCKERGVKIIDDYDQIERDIGIWSGISPTEFRLRRDKLVDAKHSYQITLNPDGPSELAGLRKSAPRPKDLFGLLEPFAPYIPQNITIYVSDHDMGSSVAPDELRNLALDAAAKGTYIANEELRRLENLNDRELGMLTACAPTSPARLLNESTPMETAMAAIAKADKSTSFMYDFKPSTSYCQNPELMRYHGAFTFHQRRSAELRPIFQLSKLAQCADFLITPVESYKNASSPAGKAETSEWADKTINQLFWRGSTTGDAYTQPKPGFRPNYDWRTSHRPRTHLFAQNKDGDSDVWVKRSKGWTPERWSNEELNKKYLDVGFAGRIRQCDSDGTCEEMAAELIFKPRVQPNEAIKYKYVLDVDGNGWSSRFHRLLASGSVVVKNTIYPEWNSDWLTPWVHYVPSKIDYSDLYDIMSFFVGPPDDELANHDALARQIAANARRFTTEHWRWEDMQAYMFRILLEYNRLGADDREAHSYTAE